MINNVVEGHIAENILKFSRILRSAGLSVGPPEILDAIGALSLVGFSSREDLYWLLFSNFVKRSDQRQIFDQAFHIFWKNPQIMERMMSLMLPVVRVEDNVAKQIFSQLKAIDKKIMKAINRDATERDDIPGSKGIAGS